VHEGVRMKKTLKWINGDLKNKKKWYMVVFNAAGEKVLLPVVD
jgi:hypothetical protein